MDRLISAENNKLLWAFCASCFPAKWLMLCICMEIWVPSLRFIADCSMIQDTWAHNYLLKEPVGMEETVFGRNIKI